MYDYAYASIDGAPEDIGLLWSAPMLAFDVEGSGVHPRMDVPFGFSLAHNTTSAYYSGVENQYFRALLARPGSIKLAHNAKYDRTMMKKAGVIIDDLYDTMIAAHLLNANTPSLSLRMSLAGYCNMEVVEYSALEKPLLSMSTNELLKYSGPHSIAVLLLWEKMSKRLEELGLMGVFKNIEMPLIPVLSDMELNGVLIDKDYLSVLGDYFSRNIEVLVGAMKHWSGADVNFNSPDQMADVFYEKLGISPNWRTTRSGRPSVTKPYLESVKHTHPIIPLYLRFRECGKLKNTYVDSLLSSLVNGRVHGSFNQTRTTTGRLSSSDPGLQNIPVRSAEGKKIRRAFIAPIGKTLVKADADQLELKQMAVCSKDPHMLAAFRENRDIHLETALRVYKDASRRFEGKTINFMTQYGGGDAKQQAAFYGAYPGVKEWTGRTIQECREAGYARTLGGRIRVIPELWSSNRKAYEHGGREAISTIVQGSSAEVIKIGMRRVWDDIRDTVILPLLQVHDEVLYEVPDELVGDFAPYLKKRMQYDEYEIPITVTVSVGKNWRDMQEFKHGGS